MRFIATDYRFLYLAQTGTVKRNQLCRISKKVSDLLAYYGIFVSGSGPANFSASSFHRPDSLRRAICSFSQGALNLRLGSIWQQLPDSYKYLFCYPSSTAIQSLLDGTRLNFNIVLNSLLISQYVALGATVESLITYSYVSILVNFYIKELQYFGSLILGSLNL